METFEENWNKWQGFSFYTAKTAVEKCLTVKFSVSLQPVLSFIGGLSFDILPDELFELVTTVCWPNQMPGGLDLSVLRSEIKTSNNLLFSRTLRLAKRFGKDTDFVKKNLDSSYKTWRSSIGIAEGESGFAFAPMSLLGGNRSDQVQGDGQETEYWIDPEELYLSSIDYGDSMEPNRTWELRGEDAMLRLSKMQEAKKTRGETEVVELFSFKKPGNVSSFHVRGLLDGNILELGVQMGYGPYQSPSRRIPLADIGAQFAVVLAAIPWISVETKKTAVAALKDFWPGQEELEGPQPADKSSMVAWFKSEDADSAWKSAVGSWQAHMTGSVTKKVEAGHGATYPVVYLTGDVNAGIDFGKIMKPDFTICSVTRYVGEGGRHQRILQHLPNWLHGHWNGAVGVAHYNHWVTSPNGLHWRHPGLTGWLVMCGNSAGVVFRSRDRRNVAETAAEKSPQDAHLYINLHTGELSDFGVMEVIVWNRALSEQEMWTSMKYLNSKLGPQPEPADMSSMVAWFQSEDASADWKSSVGSWQGRVTRGSVTRKVEAGYGAKFPVAYLAGDPHAGYDFGQIMKQDYTICSVTRYIEGGVRKRILQHNQPNWLHGHWEGKVGVTFYNWRWVNEDGLLNGLTDWLVLCGNSAGVVLRGQERKNLGQHAPGGGSPDAHLYINEGHYTESSDFGVMEVIVWNRALSEQEMWTSMKYLNWKLSGL